MAASRSLVPLRNKPARPLSDRVEEVVKRNGTYEHRNGFHKDSCRPGPTSMWCAESCSHTCGATHPADGGLLPACLSPRRARMNCRWQKDRVSREGVVTGSRGPTVTSKLWTGTASIGMASTVVARQTAFTNTYSVSPQAELNLRSWAEPPAKLVS
jgi:hypothetical protein